MSGNAPTLEFEKIDKLRRAMLLTIGNMADFLGVSRETYYNYLSGKKPRVKRAHEITSRVRELLVVMTHHNWPSPEVISANQKDRYAKLLEVVATLR